MLRYTHFPQCVYKQTRLHGSMDLFAWTLGTLGINLQTLIIAIVTYILVRILTSPKNLPPGPVGVPVLGALPLLGKTPHLTALKWTEKYGDLICIYMGSRLAIILNSYDLVQECLVRQEEVFSGRPWMYLRKLTKDSGDTDVLFSLLRAFSYFSIRATDIALV